MADTNHQMMECTMVKDDMFKNSPLDYRLKCYLHGVVNTFVNTGKHPPAVLNHLILPVTRNTTTDWIFL